MYLSLNSNPLRRGVCLGLAALTVGVLVGCGPTSSPSASTGTTGSEAPSGKQLTVGIVFDTGGRGDKSFNDSAWRGLERAEKELGIKTMPIESKSEKDYAANLAGAAENGADLVVAVGINMKTALEQAAKDNPNTKFAIIDADVTMENVRSLLFTEHEGSFLVGYLAGLMSKSGKIGFIGGQEIDLIKKFEVGYTAGAKMANPNITVLPAKYTGSWDNIDIARGAAKLLYGEGADIIYAAAGRAGLGVIRSAKDEGKFAIGVDSDQDDIEPGSVLTSMIKRVDEAVFQTVNDMKDGKFAAGTKVYDLAANGVGTSEFIHTKDKIGEENLKKLEAVRERIVKGEIKVPSNPIELAAFKPAP